MPYYTEISRIPLMIAHPAFRGNAGKRVSSLTQTTDLMPTILELWGLETPSGVTGVSLLPLIEGETRPGSVRTFGMFGGPIGVTDGDHIYFRYPENYTSSGLNEYTLIPHHMNGPFRVDELKNMELHEPFDFTKGVRTLKIAAARDAVRPPGPDVADFEGCRDELFDLRRDPGQNHPIADDLIGRKMEQGIIEDLVRHDTPPEVFKHYRLGAREARSRIQEGREA
jgi:hypothetical protein